MDRDSRSPETEELSDRAGSSEPSSIRPNPFEHDAENLRKRRRTAAIPDSAETDQQPPTAALEDIAMTTVSSRNSSRTATPRSLGGGDDQSEASPAQDHERHGNDVRNDQADGKDDHQDDQQALPATSHVTLSLRNPQRQDVHTIPSTPSDASTPPQSPTPARPRRPQQKEDDAEARAEQPDSPVAARADADSEAGKGDASGASRAATIDASGVFVEPPLVRRSATSSPVEVIEIQGDDDDVDSALADPPVTLLSEEPNGEHRAVLVDPTLEFPYQNPSETPAEIMAKIINYITIDLAVAQNLRDWIDSYLNFSKNVGINVVYDSYEQHRQLWLALPELLWGVPGFRSSAFVSLDPVIRERLLDFCDAFARLTAHFVSVDAEVLQHFTATGRNPTMDLISSPYLSALAATVKRDPLILADDCIVTTALPADDISEIVDEFASFHEAPPHGTLRALISLLLSEINLLPRFPRMSDHLMHTCVATAFVVREAHRRLTDPELPRQYEAVMKERIFMGHQVFLKALSAFEILLGNQITHVNPESLSQQLVALSDIVRLSLQIGNPQASDFVSVFHTRYPNVPMRCVPEGFATEWRFRYYCRLVKCSQMQLRVMAVSNLCQDLVHLWRRYGEPAPENIQEPILLDFLANYLEDSGVIAYLLGPTCHPEIIAESSNIFGFLAVLRRFTNAHSDLFWQTVTTTQDPRISEALIKSANQIAQLFSYPAALYLCRKFLDLPIAAFTPPMRNFCAAIFQQVCLKFDPEVNTLDAVPFDVCLRLLRDSSVPGTTTPMAYPDVQNFAIDNLSELLKSFNLDAEQRQSLYRSCLSDLEAKSATTLGSLCAIYIMNRHYGGRDLANLAASHNLTGLVVAEIHHAAGKSRELVFPEVISGPTNGPRRDIVFQIINSLPVTLTPDLSARLWNVMAGPQAACQDDRNASWKIFIACAQRARADNNPFLTQALSQFVPNLPPDCFCDGLLNFLCGYLAPLLADKGSHILDPVDNEVDGEVRKPQAAMSRTIDQLTLEQLWRVALTAPPGTIECQAIECLVKDVYIESPCIRALDAQRARKVHLAVVNRCLQQLSAAATKLKPHSRGASDSPLADEDVDSKVKEEEVLFVRSLQVLQLFVRLYSEGSHFAAPDISRHIPERANSVDGESAELRYQFFDGNHRNEISPLDIGRRNTVGSLLATIREATGCAKYHMYFRGHAWFPKKADINRSLEDLRIQNGLILVKSAMAPSEAGDNSVLPSVEGEILSHFDELWDYLSMEEKLASGIYGFLSNFGGNERFFKFEQADVSYDQVFIVGQPYKSLYALHALQDFVANICRSDADTKPAQPESEPMESVETCPADGGSAPEPAQAQEEAVVKVLGLVIAAIRDPKITEESVSEELRVILYTKLIGVLQSILKGTRKDEPPQYENLDATLLARLMDILAFALNKEQNADAQTLIESVFGAILEVCASSRDCWDAFKTHQDAAAVVERLLLGSNNDQIRYTTEKQLVRHAVVGCDSSATVAAEFRPFFWPIVLEMVPKALGEPAKCRFVFSLVDSFMKMMLSTVPPTLDVPDMLRRAGELLLSYTSIEEFNAADDQADHAMLGLLCMFTTAYRAARVLKLTNILPRNFGHRLFWKHLFPPWRSVADESSTNDTTSDQKLYPRVVMNSATREMLMKVLFELTEENPALFPSLVRNLDQLVPCERAGDDDPYHYDLPPLFDRSKALRAPCGYAGLRNLSNTCYFNSLFTQLFMNVPFRQFMMNADIRDENDSQTLLFQTRVLFGFLQDSIRRFVDTQMCVASVKSYDDSPLDIHSQMDVDEFFNLVFDRLESQLQSAEEKKAFRKFFGGQLVQQVRSKDCEHVSERLDPFLAIQLVIKGKASLAESLETYVDGEVLEGDNKYKCSTCDRHVDAVKRSCLKEIPNNLIFHLKRFDFSLRTLQRSKINDYFSFPLKIDMRPYTIDYLSDPDKEHEPDMFELVGVLVHSGTAESGHYYSFIRERPSFRVGNNWMEFNDDAVSAWDPSQMEALCFGGTEIRPNSQYGGAAGDGSTGVVVDKSFSAYMLFYERSSTLEQEQTTLAESQLSSPARAPMPPKLAEHIRSENTLLIRRHVLFDPRHIPFVSEVLDRLWARGACSKEHALENQAVEMAISHLDQVASRTRDFAVFEMLHGRLLAMCGRCAQCSLAVVDYFDERPVILRQMVQRALEPGVRVDSAALLIRAFQKVKAVHPELYGVMRDNEADSATVDADGNPRRDCRAVLNRDGTVLRCAAHMMSVLWNHFHAILRSWPEVFNFMVCFVSLGRAELAIFLEVGGFRRALLAIGADPNIPTEQQYTRMLVAVQRRPANRPPSYENLIVLLDAMLEKMYGSRGTLRSADEAFVDDQVDRYALALQYPNADLPMKRSEFALLARDWNRGCGNVFMDKLISLNQEPVATDSVLARLMATIPMMEFRLFTTLKANISGQADAGYQEPFLRVARLFLRVAQNRDKALKLLQHIAEQCRGIKNPEGRSFFETFASQYHGQTEQAQQQQQQQQPTVDVAAILQGLQVLPVWVPGLLGYHYDSAVTDYVEGFLQDSVFRYGLKPAFSEEEGGAERAAAVVTAAKELGVQCLRYVQQLVVERKGTISQSKSVALQRVLTSCRRYYGGDGAASAASATAATAASEAAQMEDSEETTSADEDAAAATREDALAREFRESAIHELLKRLAVEDIEEDGSVSDEQDWGSSRCSSEGVESMGDVSTQAAVELHDVDML